MAKPVSYTERYEMCLWVLEQGKWKCEVCHAGNGETNEKTRKKITLYVEFLDADKNNIRRNNLRAICKDCYQIAHDGAAQIRVF